MLDIEKIVTELRQVPSGMIGTQYESLYWTCHSAAAVILRLKQQIDDYRAIELTSQERRERNQTILRRKMDGERTKDLAAEYGISQPAISKIYQRERDKQRKEEEK